VIKVEYLGKKKGIIYAIESTGIVAEISCINQLYSEKLVYSYKVFVPNQDYCIEPHEVMGSLLNLEDARTIVECILSIIYKNEEIQEFGDKKRKRLKSDSINNPNFSIKVKISENAETNRPSSNFPVESDRLFPIIEVNSPVFNAYLRKLCYGK